MPTEIRVIPVSVGIFFPGNRPVKIPFMGNPAFTNPKGESEIVCQANCTASPDML